jgi:hypothetical protein
VWDLILFFFSTSFFDVVSFYLFGDYYYYYLATIMLLNLFGTGMFVLLVGLSLCDIYTNVKNHQSSSQQKLKIMIVFFLKKNPICKNTYIVVTYTIRKISMK